MARDERDGRVDRRNGGYERLDSLAGSGIWVGLFVFVVTAGYIFYGAASGAVGRYLIFAHADRVRMLSNIGFAARAAEVSLACLVLCIIIRYFNEGLLGFVFAAMGALGYFLAPNATYNVIGGESAKANPAAALVIGTLQVCSLILFIPGVGLSARTLVLRLLEGLIGTETERQSGRRVDKEESRRGSVLYPKCWDMLYCKSAVRQFCPAWRKRKPCWRLGTGCLCGDPILFRALQRSTQDPWLDRQLRTGAPERSIPAKTAGRRGQCRNCAIYVEHQRRKYQLVAPLVFIVVPAVVYKFFGQISSGMSRVIDAINRLMQFASFNPGDELTPQFSGSADHTVLVLLVGWMTVILIIYILKGVEYCIFKLRL